MTPETLRHIAECLEYAHMDNMAKDAIAAADAWDADIAEKHELARMHANEYGNLKIANANAQMLHAVRDADALRKRLEAAEKERDAWQLAYYERDIAYNKLVRRLEAAEAAAFVFEGDCEVAEAHVEALELRLKAADGLLADLRCSAIEFKDPRVGYVTVQIDRGTWAALAGEEKP